MTKLYQRPLFNVPSNWKPPETFPNLSEAKVISLDIETCDPQLMKKGPGVRRDGYMIGIAVGVPENKQWYFPFGHQTGSQFDKEIVLKWAKEELCRPNQPKVGANLLYDLDYLYHSEVKVSGPFYDVQVAEPLIDENRRYYNLDALSKDYLKEGKENKLIEAVCKNQGWAGKPQAHLWKMDPKYVGPYAEVDVERPLRIFKKQVKKLKEQDLEKLFNMETRLIPVLLAMRQRGVKINVEKLHHVHSEMKKRLKIAHAILNKEAGQHIDYWAAESIAKVFDKKDIAYERTLKTKAPSFTKAWLKHHYHPISKAVVECRKIDKFVNTFLEGSMINMLINDRIHCQFNQLKSDETGTVTGRFSSSSPNLQFIPERDPELGPLCRSIFIPFKNETWGKADYSQIEIRILAHYALGKGANDIRERFNTDPTIDYHQWCANEAKVSRKSAKTINFGIIYGMGAALLAKELDMSFTETKMFMEVYFDALPFLKETVNTATRVAQHRGYVKTILGRRRRFDQWEPSDYNLAKQTIPTTKEKALEITNRVQRAKTYKAFNAADQGSAADIIKKAMVDVWESGVCDILGPPLLTVHDELDVSIPITNSGKEAFKEMKHIMETAVPLKVPIIVDLETGENWGELNG